MLASITAYADVIFLADFKGAGGGTGGSNDMVALGGTGKIQADGINTICLVTNANPFTPGGGNYLNVRKLASGGPSAPVLFSFASAANAWPAWQGVDIVDGNGNHDIALHGAYDVFFRVDGSGSTNDMSSIRPISGDGANGLSLILNGQVGGYLILQIANAGFKLGVSPAAIVNFTSSGGSIAYDPNYDTINMYFNSAAPLTNGLPYHLAFSLDTNPNGLTTAGIYLKQGTGSIDSQNDRVGWASFSILSSNLVSVSSVPTRICFTNQPWNFAAEWASDGPFVADYAQTRIYNSVPSNFTALAASSLPVTNPVPFLLKVSDGIAPGRSFSINGEGIYPTATNVAMALDTSGNSPSVPPTDAIYPPVIQTDKDGHFAVVRMPAGLSPGVYNVWVANNQGWSACAKLNAARALFISDYQAYSGLDIEVVGRNFDQSEFGGITATQVRLNNGTGTTYTLPVKDLNPYHVTFTVGNQPLGTYYVEVSSDNGVNWSRLAGGQTLTLLAAPPAGSDPLGLGVSWAKDFRWTNVFNVTNYGANPNDLSDGTIAVQNAANAAENSGGGVVYFPNGNYYVSYIALGAGVVLEGQDQYNTKIYYNGTGGNSFIASKGTGSRGGIPQLQGIANLSILLSNPETVSLRPDIIINLGDQWGGSVSDQTLRTANRLFIAGVNLNYPCDTGDSSGPHGRRGIGAIWIGKERVLLKDNHFTGWGANNLVTFLNQYCTLKNNRFEYSSGYVHDTATYLFYESNYIKVHPEYNQDSHGYFGRAGAYMAGNYVEGAGDASNVNNDGEALCTEVPGGTFNYGAVLNAVSNSLTVTTVIPLVNPVVEYGNLSIAITQGTGLGQVKTVAAINTNTGVVTLLQPFDVVPDATSKFTLYAPLQWFTVYSNTLVNCAKGIWGFGNQYDGVVADNTSIDCNGIFVWSARSGPPATTGSAQDCPDFFDRITRNTAIGVSRRSNQGGIGTYTGRFDNPKFYDVEVYATEIIDNHVAGNNAIGAGSGTEAPPYDGIYVSSYPFSTGSDGTGTGDATETLIESNHLSNLPTGVILTKCDYGQLVNANTYDNSVLTFMNNTTGVTDNTLITSNFLVSSNTLSVIMTQPQNQSVLTNGTPTFTVLATGIPAPFYQWRKNNVAINGAHGTSYTTPSVVLGDNGSQFSVIVSNSTGSVISSNAILKVAASPVAPVITIPPQNQTVSIGRSATFTVVTSGIPAPAYQWQTNGVNIPGAASASYTTWLLGATDNGTIFRCIVANGAGSTTSSPALLGVVDPTPILYTSTMMADGLFESLLQGAPGRSYVIQTSSNLNTWNSLESITLSNTSAYFTDDTGTNLPYRFYRAVLIP